MIAYIKDIPIISWTCFPSLSSRLFIRLLIVVVSNAKPREQWKVRLKSVFLLSNNFTKTRRYIWWCSETRDSTETTGNVSTVNQDVAISENDRAIALIRVRNFRELTRIFDWIKINCKQKSNWLNKAILWRPFSNTSNVCPPKECRLSCQDGKLDT